MERLAKYQLVDPIAAGEIAATFRAFWVTSAGIIRPVAVKRLHAALEREVEMIALLVEEGRISAELDHPNLVHMLDLDQDAGRWFLVTDRTPGRNLAELMVRARARGVAVDPATAIYVVMQLLEGLAHAHERTDADGDLLGLVHRDVCPANVLIGYRGEVKLGGFGYAKTRLRTSPPPPGLAAPRWSYASPEQAANIDVDHRAEVVSAGLVLYELLSGHPPYPARTREEMLALAQRGEVRLLSEVAPHVGPEVRSLVDRALAFDRRARHPSASSFRDELARVLHQREPQFGAHRLASFVARVLAEEAAEDRRLEAAARAELEVKAAGLPPIVAAHTSSSGPDTNARLAARRAEPTPTPIAAAPLAAKTPAPAVAPMAARSAPSAPEPAKVDELTPTKLRPTPAVLTEGVPATSPARAPAAPAPAAPAAPPAAKPTPAPAHTFEERHFPFGRVALALVAASVIAVGAFALSSTSNTRLVQRKLRAVFIGRQPGGTLTIESLPPGASVTLDDEATGRKTPLTVENIESGVVHDVRLELAGETPVTSTISVRPNQKQSVTLVFPDAMVNLSVKTEPPGAELFVDNRSVALTPASMMVRVGQQLHVRVAKTGYLDYVEALTPERRSALNLDVKLEKTEELKAEEARQDALLKGQ